MARLLLWLAVAGGTACTAAELPAPAGPRLLSDGEQEHRTCAIQQPGYPDGLHATTVHLDGIARRFLVFKPSGDKGSTERVPLWILAPGAYDTAEEFLAMSQMTQFAQQKKIAFIVLQGAGGGSARLLNVALRSRALPGLPDDIRYTRVVLRMVTQRLCVDMDRIRCTGYSRGARFCSRLASELSSFIAGIAPVGGVRFPTPNNATRSLPIIAIHGTRDSINPYWGKGDPSYWEHSVPDAIEKWANFNGCRSAPSWKREAAHVAAERHTQCKDDADVVLVMIQGGGHTWPGSTYDFAKRQFGTTSREVSANQLMWNFFNSHPRKNECRTAEKGSLCYDAVWDAMKEGIGAHPEWAGALNSSSSFQDYQAVLHNGFYADCPRPCPGPALTTSQPKTSSALPPAHTTAAAETPTVTTTAATTPTAPTVAATTTAARTTSKELAVSTADMPGTPLERIEGRWTHQQDPGGFVERVGNGKIRWDSGIVTEIKAHGSNDFTTQWQGSTSHAHVVDGHLVWDDGDVWIRVGAASHYDDENKGGAAIGVGNVKVKDKGALFKRRPHAALAATMASQQAAAPPVAVVMAALLAMVSVPVFLAMGLLAIRRARRRGAGARAFLQDEADEVRPESGLLA